MCAAKSKMVVHFPDEIIQEIMVRLPVKSLLSFKCVSRIWRSLISSQQFIKKHLEFNSSLDNDDKQRLLILSFVLAQLRSFLKSYSLNSLFAGRCSDAVNFDLPVEITHWGSVAFIASCNGLIFAVVNDLIWVLWNPSLRKLRKLSNLGVDVAQDTCAYGFGYDESTRDYKVAFAILYHDDKNKSFLEIKVYSTKTESSKKIGDFPGQIAASWPWWGVFANGKIYWHLGFSNCCDILFVDLATDTFGEMELGIDWPCCYRSLGTYGNDLSLICGDGDGDGDGINWKVWVMKQHGDRESWTKVLNIPADVVKVCVSSALYVSGSGEVLGAFDGDVKLYNPKNCSLRSIPGLAEEGFYNMWIRRSVESMIDPMADDHAPGKQLADEG